MKRALGTRGHGTRDQQPGPEPGLSPDCPWRVPSQPGWPRLHHSIHGASGNGAGRRAAPPPALQPRAWGGEHPQSARTDGRTDRRTPRGLSAHLLRVVVGRQRRVVALLDLLAQRVQVHLVAVEGALQGGHLQKARDTRWSEGASRDPRSPGRTQRQTLTQCAGRWLSLIPLLPLSGNLQKPYFSFWLLVFHI